MSCESAPRNFFSQVEFRFINGYTPNLEHLVQKVHVPAIDVGMALVQTPFVKMINPGNMSYGQLNIEFKLDEKLKAYDEVLDWLEAIGHPDNLSPQYQDVKKDIRVIVLNSSKNAMRELTFTDAFPTHISEIPLDSTLLQVPYLTCSASFAFQRMFRKNLINT